MPNSDGPAAPLYWRVEQERARLGWSATDLAQRSGVDRGTVHRMRTGRRAPLPVTVAALAQALSIDREEALRLAGLLNEDQLTPAQVAERHVRAAMVEALRHRLPDVDERILARVALNMGEIFQGVANELFQRSKGES